MQLFVRGQNTHTLEVTGDETVGQIKAALQDLEGVQFQDALLVFAGCPLEDEASLASCGVSEHSTLEVAGRLLGGKVHGSLARAGKVRGQTPKPPTTGTHLQSSVGPAQLPLRRSAATCQMKEPFERQLAS
uniref:FAU ubiquitin like and ribosomal protein S30 fusion a n=1 Tax=Amphiprion percula TaxID=161767 RepID=A0A3P8U891_AMPPE